MTYMLYSKYFMTVKCITCRDYVFSVSVAAYNGLSSVIVIVHYSKSPSN